MLRLTLWMLVVIGLVVPCLSLADAHMDAVYQPVQACGGGIFNLTELTRTDLQWTGRNNDGYNYTWYLRPCGAVAALNCSSTYNSTWKETAMLCQRLLPVSANMTYASAYNAPAQTQWSLVNHTLSMSVQNGQICTGQSPPITRATTIHFVCNSSTTTAYLVNISESSKCRYTAIVETALVCGKPSPFSSTSSLQALDSGGLSFRSQLGLALAVVAAIIALLCIAVVLVWTHKKQQKLHPATLYEAGVAWLPHFQYHQQKDATTNSRD